MFWSKNKKNRYTPRIPQFFCIKVGFKGVFIARTCFLDDDVFNMQYDSFLIESCFSGKFFTLVICTSCMLYMFVLVQYSVYILFTVCSL